MPEPSVNALFDEIARSEELKKKNQLITNQYEELKNQKAVTPEGTILQADLNKLKDTIEDLDKTNKAKVKENLELKEA